MAEKLKIAVVKFASCSGCQGVLLDAEEELPLLVDNYLDIQYFIEATSMIGEGPYDLALVEGSISVPEDLKRVKEIRERSKIVATIGACATTGGIQALRNWASLNDFSRIVYLKPEWIASLDKSTPISEHVKVDYELNGCPISKQQLLDFIVSMVIGKRPRIERNSVCVECKRLGNVCVLVANKLPCMGPVTKAGCGALCPSYGRDCYSCFGPFEDINVESLKEKFKEIGLKDYEVLHKFREFTGYSKQFREVKV
ncbi:MAG: oxidoreductase [Nitrososphaeria archaeon]